MTFRFDEFELNAETLELTRDGQIVKADMLVVRLLHVLVEHAGELVTKRELLARVWGGQAVSENVITVAMTRLRKTLGHKAGEREFVANVHGRGYRFIRPVVTRGTAGPVVAPQGPSLKGLPFVGRDRVLELVRAAMELSRSGHGSVCMLMGEAGIGKTSVVEVIESEALSSGFAVAWGSCREPGQTPPLWPFVEIVRGLLDQARVDFSEPRFATALGELARSIPALDVTAIGAPSPARTTSDHRLFDMLVRVLSLASERTPCVLVLDDLHNADSASLEVMRYWIGEIARSRVLVIGTLRKGVKPEPPAEGNLAYVLGHRNSTRVDVERLKKEDVERYVSAVLDDPNGVLAHSIFLKSEGNPFFMAELVRLTRDGTDVLVSARSVSSAALDLLRQRVGALDETLRGALSVAAVIGNKFDLAILQSVSGVAPAVLMESLDAALAADVVVTEGDSKTAFRFSHDLLRTVLFEGLEKPARRALHLRVVETLERRGGEGFAVQPSELAHHSHSALPEGDPRKAVRYCADAATDSARLFAYGDGVRYLRYALEALALVPNPSPRLRLRLLLERALYARVCSSPEFEPSVRAAMRLARDLGAPAALARAALMLDLHPGFPAVADARAALEEALQSLPPDGEERAAVLGRLASSAPAAYDERASFGYLERGRELAESAKTLLSTYTILSARLYALGGPVHRSEALQVIAELEQLFAENAQTLRVAPGWLDLDGAIRAAQRGALDEMTEALERCAARCRKVGNHELLWHAERFRLLSRIDAGEGVQVREELRKLHRRAEREVTIGSGTFVAYDESVVLSTGSTSEVRSSHEALAFHPDDPPGIWSLKVRALAASDRNEEARRSLREVPAAHLIRLPCDRDYLGTLGALARAALAVGELEYAEAIAELLSPHQDCFALHLAFFCEGSVPELLGSIACAMGKRNEGLMLLEAGAARSAKAGFSRCARRAREELASHRSAG
jgi:DNA-binding winged helix-turn-helix (wHTH) protein